MRSSKLIVLSALCLLVLFGTPGASLAGDSPDSRISPLTNSIEIADPVWAVTNYDIQFIVNAADGTQEIVGLTSHPANDLRPRLDGAANGETWVVWWRDVLLDQVLVRHRRADGSWAPEHLVSDPLSSSRRPEVVHDGARTFVVFECSGVTGTSIAAAIITDEPDPIGLHGSLALTSYAGDLDVRVHAAAGHVWATWVHSGTHVGWVEYDEASDTWTAPFFEPYALDDTRSARERIRQAVLGS